MVLGIEGRVWGCPAMYEVEGSTCRVEEFGRLVGYVSKCGVLWCGVLAFFYKAVLMRLV